MINKLRTLLKPQLIYCILLPLTAISYLLRLFLPEMATASRIFLGLSLLYACRPGSLMHSITMEDSSMPKRLLTALVALVTVAICILPMDQFPLWNGEIPGHRNQYELMAEAILDGRIDFAYGDEEKLAGLENPYDPDERKEAGVYYHWDHAYYNGKYYMYFGIVPVFLAFLPYRVLTGTALTTYHATQLFAALTIIGIFALFHLLSKLFFKKLPYSVYLALSVAFSVMSVWYSSAEPALYCTAITAALALEIWSIYFFVNAVWGEHSENRSILLAGIGALLGALVFGCRPPIALANILVLPMLYAYLRRRKFTLKLLGKLALAALPYAIVAAALMVYNYARFEDPFQFGQAYQLTVADQSNYKFTLDSATILRLFNNTSSNLFGRADIVATFPYLKHGGVYWNFPILLLTAAALKTSVRSDMRQKHLTPFLIGLLVTIVIITALDIMWTPYLLERYRMDIYFLAGIACFISVGLWLKHSDEKARNRISTLLMVLAVFTVICSFLYCMRTANVYYPERVKQIGELLSAK